VQKGQLPVPTVVYGQALRRCADYPRQRTVRVGTNLHITRAGGSRTRMFIDVPPFLHRLVKALQTPWESIPKSFPQTSELNSLYQG